MIKKYVLPILATIILVMPAFGYAWDDCPFGLENDPYPGECSRYVDTDGDGICDLSQAAPEDRVVAQEVEASEPVPDEQSTNGVDAEADVSIEDEDEYYVHISGRELKALTIAEVAELWGGIPTTCLIKHLEAEEGVQGLTVETTIQSLHDQFDLGPSVVKAIAQAVYEEKYGSGVNATDALSGDIQTTEEEMPVIPANPVVDTTEQKASITDQYNLTVLFFISLVIFLIGKILVYNKTIKATSEKRFWNVLLLVAFIGSGFTGLILSMRRDYGIFIDLPRDFLWLHAETSITMAFIAIYHMLWHWRYYVRIIQNIGKKK